MKCIKQTITKLFSNKSKEQSLDEKLALQVLSNTPIEDMETYSDFGYTSLKIGSFKFLRDEGFYYGHSEVSFWYENELIAYFEGDSRVYKIVDATHKEMKRRKHEKLVKGLLEKVNNQ